MDTLNKLNIVPPRLFDAGWSRMAVDTVNLALMYGAGTATTPVSDGAQADKNFIGYWLKTTATSGTTRGMYLRLYLASGAGGEALRLFTTVQNATPADTVNGAHISLNFGSSAGNVTGEGQAVRSTLHLGNRSMTGTLAALKAELVADGSSSAVGGTMSFIRASASGDATGVGKIDDSGYLLHVDGLTAGAAHLWRTGLTAATVNAATTCALRINVGGTAYYIPVATATA